MKITYQLRTAIKEAALTLFNAGHTIHTEKWQGLNIADKPEMKMIEVLNHSFSSPIPPTPKGLETEASPNMPWAEDHFKERVSWSPLNPGQEYKNWPFYRDKPENDIHRKDEVFTHSYMERIWASHGVLPKNPIPVSEWEDREVMGLRYKYGDMADVIRLLEAEPFTRQAYLPIWFPEDTGAIHGGRVPCTLGYHFIRRDRWLHCVYPIRSCDFFRHFRDDIYLAGRKVQWLIEELRAKTHGWDHVVPGTLTMHITSLHCFAQERGLLQEHFR